MGPLTSTFRVVQINLVVLPFINFVLATPHGVQIIDNTTFHYPHIR
jgi:hypothetical protein